MSIPKAELIWMDGEYVPWDEARVHILTPTLHYGWGVFEGIRAYATERGPAVFELTAHIRRLLRSARVYPPLDEIPFDEAQITEAVLELIRRNGHEACYIRPVLYLGYGVMGLNPLPNRPRLSVVTWEWGTYLGEEALRKGVRVMISSYRRIGKNTIPPASKTNGQYINSSLARVEAIRAGYDEALMLSEDGFLAEGTGENLFVISNGELWTPPLHDGPLGGITRGFVLDIARDLGLPIVEKSLVRTDLFWADEVFLTGTAAEVTPVREVEGRRIGCGTRGPLTEKIQSIYLDAVRGEVEKYLDRLTFVRPS